MEVRFWGVRGSIAKAGPTTARYGGNTSCVEVRTSQGTLIVIDCGTGAHGLGVRLMGNEKKPIKGHLFISHTHWDHIQGLPFFAPLFVPGNEWDIYAPAGLSQSLRETLAGQMQYTYFPITLESLGAMIRYHELVEGAVQVADATVHTHYLNHPALTLGYRIDADDVSVIYSCDHEPHSRALASGLGAATGEDERHLEFLRDADFVIHDAQYGVHEYANKVGWGHSTPEYAVALSRAAGVGTLALTHHDPLRDDEALDAMVAAAQTFAGPDLMVVGAQEGPTYAVEKSQRRTASALRPTPSALGTIATDDRSIVLSVASEPLAKLIRGAAAADRYNIHQANAPADVVPIAQKIEPSLIVLEPSDELDTTILSRAIRRRKDNWNENVPIIVVSQDQQPASQELSGINDWLTTPISQEYLRSRMRAWLLRTAVKWKRAPLLPEEARRLGVLHDSKLLDTGHEERFDRITRLASALMDVPIALVSLVDRDRQWFKSCVGLGVSETSRDAAFCAHAILQPDVMVVPDTLVDDRFAENPLVTGEPRVRFYAGCPLVLDGSAIGTLCCIDTRPRQFAPAKIAALRELAALAVNELNRPA